MIFLVQFGRVNFFKDHKLHSPYGVSPTAPALDLDLRKSPNRLVDSDCFD